MTAQLDFASLAVESLEVGAAAKELLATEQAARDGRAARTLAKSDALTVVLTVVKGGRSVSEHAAPGPVVIVPVVGTAEFHIPDGQPHEVSSGRILLVGKGRRHEVTAREDCAFLILIGAQA